VNQGFITGASNPTGIAVDASSAFLYWGNSGEENANRTIGRAKLTPTGAEEVENGFIHVAVNAFPQGVAVNATHIYTAVNENDNSYVFRYDIDGDPSSWSPFFDNEHPNLPGVRGIALDPGHVYWARQGGESIGRINLELEEPEREFVKEAGQPLGLALDGEHLYWSANQELFPNIGNDLYRFETEGGGLEDLTPDPSEENGAEVIGVLGASEDGSHLYFVANGVLAAGAAAGDCKGRVAGGNLGFSGECSLYLHEEGKALTYVARLGGGDATDWLSSMLNSRTEKTARVSADGKTLLFSSRRQLTSYPNEGVSELYRYRVGQGIVCVSCSPTGAPPAKAPTLGSITPPALAPFSTAATLSRNLSADGNRVFFETAEALVGADTNGSGGCPEKGANTNVSSPICLDVYEWEAKGTGSCESEAQNGGCLYLLSTGKNTEASFFGDASLDGKEAFIFTYSQLAGQDQDQLMDAYDTSVDGGLISQNTPRPPDCMSTNSCQGPVPPTPSFQSPGSESFSGPGNPKPKQACPKGKRKVHSKGKTRCVAKHKHKGKGHKRAAKKTRRAIR
jgi:hypothetical protein